MPELEGLSHVPLILASASRSRGMILREAGLQFTQKASLVDEEPIKTEMAKKGESPTATAARLARAKAEAVSEREPEAVVIGADQILALGDELFDKPTSLEEARQHLRKLRGREHRLLTAVSIVVDGEERFAHLEEPKLRMRNFSESYLDAYLEQAGERVLESVGAYQLEGLGVQLFEAVEGDFFSILGLPLLPLLDFLRGEKIIIS